MQLDRGALTALTGVAAAAWVAPAGMLPSITPLVLRVRGGGRRLCWSSLASIGCGNQWTSHVEHGHPGEIPLDGLNLGVAAGRARSTKATAK